MIGSAVPPAFHALPANVVRAMHRYKGVYMAMTGQNVKMVVQSCICLRKALSFIICGLLLLLVIAIVIQQEDREQNTEHAENLREKKKGKSWRRVNSIVTDYDRELNKTLHRLINASNGANDPEVISLVRDLMDSPTKHMIKLSRPVVQTPQSKEILVILKQKVILV